MKILTIILIVIMMTTNTIAITEKEAINLIREEVNKLNYHGTIIISSKTNQEFYAYYKYQNEHNSITFYQNSLNLNDKDFKCLIWHEIGHYKDHIKGNQEEILNEEYANNYKNKIAEKRGTTCQEI